MRNSIPEPDLIEKYRVDRDEDEESNMFLNGDGGGDDNVDLGFTVFWVRARKFQDGSPNCWRSPMKRFNQMMGEEVQSDDGFMEGDNKVQYAGSSGENSKVAKVPETNFDESIGPKVFAGRDGDSTNRGSKGDASESTPNAEENDRNVNGNKSQKCNMEEVFVGRDGDSINRGSKGDASESVCSRRFKKSKDGEVVIMGDFNEVRHKSDRFGLIFNGQGADEFNSFLANAGLEEVPLRGSAFTWCHKSATKMSKLDRFPILENLFITCPHITATTLERHSRTGMKEKYKKEIRTLDDDIDNGNGSDTVVHKKMEVINALQRIDKLNAMEIAQKTKIKLSVEGDENFRYFHGMLNKKQNQLNIRGVMVDGVWNEKPHDVKKEFFNILVTGLINQWSIELLLICVIRGCNPSFIALIPKIPDANKVNNFRPISLVGSIYKIIAKILANRLVRVLGDIINEVQLTFIAERQILDGPFILNEVLQWCIIKKKQSLIFKVDFEKAYDSVRWDFLDDVLKKFCFGNKWCDWIQTCLKSLRGSILINESLHLSFQRVVDAGLFMGIKLSHLVNLSHMFSADDTVFVGQWSDSNINTLIHVLDCFYRASGLRMNMSSKVGGSMSRLQTWKEIIDKVKSRLSKWKIKALSIGGRLTLLKSVLGSILIFHMSIFRVPSSVLHTMESIRSQFFNGHEVGSNKAMWVKGNSVLTAKDSRGLGVSSLYALNRGLMMKWVWRILSDQGVNVLEFMRLKLGNGDMSSFWKDNRSGGGVLKDLYPRLYALENGKSMNVCTKLSDPSMDYSFRRKTKGGSKHEQLDALMDLVIDKKRLPSVCSKTRWVKVESSEHLFFRCNLTRHIAHKISLWWNVNYEDVNSYDEWSTRMTDGAGLSLSCEPAWTKVLPL
nr:RNA-directed DNA polymerase, eukaryota, reverse transcriptase zinc-binding domain protein [Tanacetum cinerariifolium]